MSQSTLNSYRGPVLAGSSFTGIPEVINGSISIVCLIRHNVDLIINVFQSPDGISYLKTDIFVATIPLQGNQSRVQFYTKGQKGYIQIENLSGVDEPDLILRTLYTPNNHDGTKLQPTYVIVESLPTPGPISGTVEVSKIVDPLPTGTNALGSVSVSNFPATQPVSGTVEVSSITSALPAGTNALGSVSVSNFPAETLITGKNSNFEFYPTPANNTPAIYADGTQGVNVSSGWQYSNVANVGKINWYCYSSPTAETDYKVSQLNSMYTVINQQSTLGLAQAQNPFIIIYTRPTTTINWYQNKLFFGSNAGTDTTGTKLLYTGSDPVGVHPEIVAPNRIQLDFNLTLSTTTLALAQDEGIFLGSLQTTNNTPIGNSFSFTMQEFGADWIKTPAILPIEFGSVVVSGKVGLTSTLNTATYNQIVNAFGFQGTAYDMGDNSLVDILLLATGIIATGIIRLDYSIDGTIWVQNNTTTYTISSTDPHLTIIGLKTGSRYIRVSAGTSSLFSATNLRTIYSSKRC